MLKVFISIDSKVFYDILIKKKLAAASGGTSPDAAADINISKAQKHPEPFENICHQSLIY